MTNNAEYVFLCLLTYILKNFIKVLLIYNVVFITAVYQCLSYTCIYTFFFIFFSFMFITG